MLPPNRMTAYQQARAAERPKGMGYTELFFDNVIGLDNDYESTLEDMVDAYNADKMGFLKNAAVGAYEGAKTAVMNPLTTAEALISGLYDSGANVLSTLGPGGEAEYLDSALMEMYGVTYDQATDDQVSKAREALFGDVMNVAGVASGVGAGAKLAGGLKAGSRAAATTALPGLTPDRPYFAGDILTADQFTEDMVNDINFDDYDFEPDDAYFDAQERTLAAQTPIRELRLRQAEGGQLNAAEAERLATFDATFNDEPDPFEQQPYNAGGPNQLPNVAPLPRMADWDDSEYAGLEILNSERGAILPEERERLHQYDRVRESELIGQNNRTPEENHELQRVQQRIFDRAEAQHDAFVAGGGFQPSPPPTRDLAPAVNKVEGIAALYSPTRKAVDLLDRQQYDNIDSLRVQLLNRGAKPDEVERVISRIGKTDGPVSKDRLAALADEQAGELQVRRVNPNNTPYGGENRFVTGYFVDGAENLQANVFELPVVNKPDFSEAHFAGSSQEAAPVLHTRTGMLSTKGANRPDSYHVGEIQSDWAQKRAKLFETKEEADKAFDRLTEIGQESGDVYKAQMDREREIQDAGGDPNSDVELNRLTDKLEALEQERSALFGRLQDFRTYGTRDRFDLDYPAPYVGTTSKWVQLGLRQSLIDAVNSGARQMSLSTGEMVKNYTYGSLKGQQKFYDDIVPKQLNEVLKKFAKEAGINKPEVVMDTVYGSQGQAYTVPVVKFTDEFIDAIKRVGLSSYAKGGIVQGSLLDVDLFGDGT